MCADMFKGLLLKNKSVKRSQEQNRRNKEEKKGAFASRLWERGCRTARFLFLLVARGPFLKRPGNLTDSKSHFEIKISRKGGCVLTCNEVHFVSLADNFTVLFFNLLKLSSGM